MASPKTINNAWQRADVFPEDELPCIEDTLQTGRNLAQSVQVGASAFLQHYDVSSEIAHKQRCMANNTVMLHSQIGYRDLEKSKRAYLEIYERTQSAQGRVDRYGICLDWSMGYKEGDRKGRAKGTGLILQSPEQFSELTSSAPVAPHFGDFVMGMPAALENTVAALRAGATSIGNIGQYFTFRLPHWDDDIATTQATVSAIALCVAQPVPILIHSNLDDGFAAQFTDLSCSLGAVLLERYIVEDLLGGLVGHCYGHTFSNPLSRLAFQRALVKLGGNPGTMVYGNTTSYGNNTAANYAALSAYLSIDIQAQLAAPTGHAINPVPVTEASRIPDIDEVADAALFATELIKRIEPSSPLFDPTKADPMADQLLVGAKAFFSAVLSAFEERGIDTKNPFEMLLGLKRIGAKKLETLYGPGELDKSHLSGRMPIVETPVIEELNEHALRITKNHDGAQQMFATSDFTLCVATTDVHEYGKALIDQVAARLSLNTLDGGISTDPETLAEFAHSNNVDAIAISTYNGIGLDFLAELNTKMSAMGLSIPIFIGGKLNRIPQDTNSSLPVDITDELQHNGAIPCVSIDTMIHHLMDMIDPKKEAS